MRKTRSTTYEERLAIVKDCLANDKNYGTMALKYQCSYQQVRNWVNQYEKMGAVDLESDAHPLFHSDRGLQVRQEVA